VKDLKTNFWLKDTIVWAALCCLTVLSYLQFEAQTNSHLGRGVIFPLAVFKFLLVFLFFMRMNKANIMWRILAMAYLFIIFIIYSVF